MLSPHRKKLLEELQQHLKVTFLNEALLNQALTHRSYAHELRRRDILDNERLEFLGDAVLKIAISEYIYNRYPDYPEGDLTKIRSAIVSDVTLAAAAKRTGLGKYLQLGANERRTGGEERRSNLANALEALFAAIYLDQGLGKARDTVLELLKHELERWHHVSHVEDSKSTLQELAQKQKWGLPVYRVMRETGPKHYRVFYMEVSVRGKVMGHGKGKTKKEAEQAAAQMANRAIQDHGIEKLEEHSAPLHEKMLRWFGRKRPGRPPASVKKETKHAH